MADDYPVDGPLPHLLPDNPEAPAAPENPDSGVSLPTFVHTIPGLGQIAVPVVGVSPEQISNNFGNDRDGGARKHAGIDLGFGLPEGTEVVSPVDGWIRYRMQRPTGGYGVAVSIVDQFGNWHNLAHLHASTLDLGVIPEGNDGSIRVRAGELVGFMGTTGNAVGTQPHVHYGINEARGGTHNLVNPYELLVNGQMVESATVDPGTHEHGDVSEDAVQIDRSDRDVDGNGIPDMEEEMLGKQHLTPETRQEIRERFGHYAAFLDDPEWGPLIITATIQQWDDARFFTLLEQTERWRSTTDATRAWEALNINDPGTANARREETKDAIRTYSRRLGVALSEAQIGILAEDANRFGWVSGSGGFAPQLIDGILGLAVQGDDKLGTLDVTQQNIKDTAASQFMTVTDQRSFDLARKIALGELSEETVALQMRRDAIAQNPFFASQLEQGFTMAELMDSRRQRIASLLEIDADEIDFMNDARWRQIVQFQKDDDSGGFRPATFAELEDYVRAQDEYQYTDGAVQQAASLGEFLLQKFGAVR